MRTLHFTQITDDRFNENIKDLLKERIDAIHKQFEGIDGIVVANNSMYKVDFGDSLQYRADFYIQKNTRELTWNDVYHKINQIKAVPYEFVDRAKLEQTFKTPEAIAKKFIKDGWSENTTFMEMPADLAKKMGCLSIADDINDGHKYFIMNESFNVFDEKGEDALYNINNMISKNLAKINGLSFTDKPVYIPNEGLAFNYLEPSDQLAARAGFELSKNTSREEFEEFMNAFKKGEDAFEFFVEYDINTNKLQLKFDTRFTYGDCPGELVIPTSEIEEALLLKNLNEHCKEKTGRPFICEYDDSFEVRHSIEELDNRAEELYDEHNMDFSEFSNGELYELYKLCAWTDENPYGRAYDDEVFDEIFSRNGIDGKDLVDVFHEMYDKEVYIDPAHALAQDCKDALANGNYSEAYDKYTAIHDLLMPENLSSKTEEFQEKMMGFYNEVMKEFTNEEIYEITDYGKEKAYAEMEYNDNEER